MWQGHVVSLHVAPAASEKMRTVDEVRAVPGRGLEGDRYHEGSGFYSGRPGAGREVTLIEVESVQAIAGPPGEEARRIALSPAETRRNVVTAGVPLNHLVGREFWVG